MKFFLSVFDNYLSRPSLKYKTNIFFLKINSYFSMFSYNFITFYIKIKKLFIIKIFQFNYSIYFIGLVYFIIVNLVIQLFLTLVVIL
jgi:hypothetical protein